MGDQLGSFSTDKSSIRRRRSLVLKLAIPAGSVAVLLGLLIPAVQEARNAARRSQVL
ncbi:MAG TPA: hypothetical protein VGY53_01970 [Isosphaeraceae bacterium]|nr:hypothetical protein [Isosphaeraceae bacterium]